MEPERQPVLRAMPATDHRFSMSAPAGAPEWPPIPPEGQPRNQYKPQLSSDEWEALRPSLKRMYIDEKKTFSEIAKWLREFHNFNPTKRQFDGKVVKWGLRKNKKHIDVPARKGSAAANDKMRIGTIIFDPMAETRAPKEVAKRKGRKIVAAKPEEEIISMSVSEWSDSMSPSTDRRGTSTSISSQSSRASPSWKPSAAQSDTLSLHSGPRSSSVSLGESSSSSYAHSPSESMSTPSDTRSFTPEHRTLWDMANIPGSPRLTSLFTALRIDKEMPLLVPDIEILDIPRSYISKGEYLVTGQNNDDSSSEDKFGSNSIARVRKSNSYPRILDFGTKAKSMTINSYFHQWVKLAERTISPLVEISPFPVTKQTGSSFSAIRRFNPYKPLNLRINECQDRLQKLESHLPPDNPGVISQVQQLAELFLEVGKSKQAETLYLRVALAKRRFYGPDHPETVTEYLNIVQAKEQGGAHPEALVLHQKLHPKIIEVFGYESELGITSLTIMGGIVYHHENTKDAEVLQRQSLQLALNHLGSKHPIIPSIMADLGVIILANDSEKIISAEKLVRAGFEVECLLYGGPEAVPLHHFGGLTWILPLAGHYDESTQLVKQQVKRCWRVEGIEHYATIFNLRRVAKSLRIAGDLRGCEPKARLSYVCALNFLGLEHRHCQACLEELALSLATLEQWEESTTRYEELHTIRAQKFGLDSVELNPSREMLRKCYSMQGLYPSEDEFAHRLDWVVKNVSAEKFKTEKKARKWRWYEIDLEEEEKEVRDPKRVCLSLQYVDEM